MLQTRSNFLIAFIYFHHANKHDFGVPFASFDMLAVVLVRVVSIVQDAVASRARSQLDWTHWWLTLLTNPGKSVRFAYLHFSLFPSSSSFTLVLPSLTTYNDSVDQIKEVQLGINLACQTSSCCKSVTGSGVTTARRDNSANVLRRLQLHPLRGQKISFDREFWRHAETCGGNIQGLKLFNRKKYVRVRFATSESKSK